MTYMNLIGKEEILRRKTKSDIANNTSDLTFVNTEKKNQMTVKHIKARKRLDEINDRRVLAVELAEVWEEC